MLSIRLEWSASPPVPAAVTKISDDVSTGLHEHDPIP